MTAMHALAPVDAAWLRMDAPYNPMTITSLSLLDGPLDDVAILRALDRMADHERFRSRVAERRVGRPRWELDPTFDLRKHVRRIALPRPFGERALERIVAELASTPLDRARPLWDVHVVEGLPSGDALLVRLSHALGDGVALVRLLLAICDDGPVAPPRKVGLAPPRSRGVIEKTVLASKKAVALAKLAVLPADPHGPLRQHLDGTKTVAWTRAFPASAVERAAHVLGAKLNDILLASIAAAIREHLLARGAGDDELRVRAIEPVYIQGAKRGDALGNHFGLVFVRLPVDIADRRARLDAVSRATHAEKSSLDAPVALDLLAAVGGAAPAERAVVDIFTRKASIMVTNVPGPRTHVHFGGRTVTSMIVWAPTAGHIGFSATMLVYDDEVRVSFAADEAIVPDLHPVAAAFERDLDAFIGASS